MGAMDNLVVQLKALGDENRFRIMMMLRERPLCSCELLEVLDIAGGTLSAHLKILKESGLLSQDKKGRWVQCSISNDNAAALLEFLSQRVVSSELFNRDLTSIRQKSPAAP
jgi:ArsR family transcriptional regulator